MYTDYMIDQYIQRFNKKYQVQDNGCWQWAGWKNHDGYGFFRTLNKKDIQAHRFSAQYLGGLPIENKVVCHSCDNPGCVNPSHLFIGTQADNVDDAISKGRHKTPAASKKIQTPIGQFQSQAAAARAYKVDPATISNWLRKFPTQFFRLD